MTNKRVILLLLCFCLVSCAHMETKDDRSGAVPKAPNRVEIPSPVGLQPEKEKQINVVGSSEYFSFSLREAEIRDVLRGIAKETQYNVVVEPDVKGACTVDLKDVTLPQALEYILEPLDFTYRISERTIYVSKPKLETKVFSVNYMSLRKIGSSSVIGDTVGAGTTGASGSTIGGAAAGTTTGMPGVGSARAVQVMTTSESDMWKTLTENIKSLLSKDGVYAANSQAMTVVITDYPRHIKSVGSFLRAIEGSVHKQVMIEAKIIDVQLNSANREGVNWRLINARIGDFSFGANQVFLKTPSVLPIPGTSANPSGTAASDSYFRFFVGSDNLDINNTFIDLLKTQGTVKVVASPKIATLNNQRAVIKVARQDVYFEQQQSSAYGASPIVTFTPKFITEGLILDVMAQIDNEGNIILNIHPMLTEKVSSVANPAGGTVPILDVRETDTMVRVREGETVIIGGLIQEQKTTNVMGVPGLMDLPVVGAIFRLKEDVITRSELIVSLTPRIIYNRDGQ